MYRLNKTSSLYNFFPGVPSTVQRTITTHSPDFPALFAALAALYRLRANMLPENVNISSLVCYTPPLSPSALHSEIRPTEPVQFTLCRRPLMSSAAQRFDASQCRRWLSSVGADVNYGNVRRNGSFVWNGVSAMTTQGR